jgi:hypothetical protein
MFYDYGCVYAADLRRRNDPALATGAHRTGGTCRGEAPSPPGQGSVQAYAAQRAAHIQDSLAEAGFVDTFPHDTGSG